MTLDELLTVGGRPRVIAHRGFSGAAPENTVAACRLALGLGVDMIEIDVQLSADDEVVVIHDADLETTTNGSGRVGEHTLLELEQLDAGSSFSPAFAGETIPTLAQILDLVRDRVLLNVEIKGETATGVAVDGLVDRSLGLIREHGLRERVILSSFEPRALWLVRQLDPAIRTASLYNERYHARMSPLEVMEEVGSAAFNLGDREVTAQIVAACHRHRRPVGVYTVNRPQRMRELVALGVDALFTDRPDLMLELW